MVIAEQFDCCLRDPHGNHGTRSDEKPTLPPPTQRRESAVLYAIVLIGLGLLFYFGLVLRWF